MKKTLRDSINLALALAVAFIPLLLPERAAAAPASAQTQNTQVELSAADKKVVDGFEQRVRQYVEMRERVEERLPKLPKDATPEQIETHKTSFQTLVRAARRRARRGQLFTPDAARLIRATIRDVFKGRERQELRKELLVEAENRDVPLRINYPYPETEELLEMPPTLLLRLPQLPKQVKYRFVGSNMLLVDRENGLIVDYMTNALP